VSEVLRLSPEQARVLDTIRRGRDPIVWFEEVFGVKPNPAQRRWISLIQPDKAGWEWRYKAVLHVAANQIGKTLGLALLILWAAWYKIGIDPTSRWQQAPYVWFHLAPTQPQAYLPLTDMKLLLEGVHPSQPIDGPHQEVLRLVRPLVQQVKIEQYYDGLSLWNGAMIQFRTTDDKAKALQGRRAAGISYDEAAFEDHLTSVINETLLMRLIASGGPLWLVSTPNGINDWYEVVTAVQESAYPREVVTDPDDPLLGGSAACGEPLPIWENESQWALVWSTIADNVGYGINPDEAARMERDLDPATKEQQLRGAFLEPAEAYFVPSSQIDKAFRRDLPEEVGPKVNHKYVISWDPSQTTDPTVVIVLDVTKRPWTGVYFRRYEKPLGEALLLTEIFKLHAYYNGGSTPRKLHQRPPQAITVFDSTSMGGAMLASSLRKLTPKKALNLAGPNTKRVGLTDLRAALNTGQLLLPAKWMRVRREVLTYKLPDDKIAQDCVMTLLGNVSVAASGWAGLGSNSFRPHGRT
jgi:hypothetical protein